MRTIYKNNGDLDIWLPYRMDDLLSDRMDGCTRKPTDYRSLLNGQEITYPGKIINPNVATGPAPAVTGSVPIPA